MYKILALIGLSAAFLPGCQAPAPPAEPPVQVNLSVRYLGPERSLRGQATFFRGDSLATATPLDLPGGVSFMGSGMDKRTLPGNVIRYSSSMISPPTSPLRFAFRLEPEASLREIEVNWIPIDSFAVVSGSLAEGLVFTFSGGLRDTEELLLLFSDENREARTVLIPGPISRRRYLVPANALAGFATGPYQLYLVKKSNTSREVEPGFIVHESLEYYSEEVAFELGE